MPQGLSTSIIFTANHRTLRWLIEMRTDPGAEYEIRKVFGQIGEICMQDYTWSTRTSRRPLSETEHSSTSQHFAQRSNNLGKGKRPSYHTPAPTLKHSKIDNLRETSPKSGLGPPILFTNIDIRRTLRLAQAAGTTCSIAINQHRLPRTPIQQVA